MSRISLFILLILIFLGLSKSFSPSEKKTDFIINEQVFSHFFKSSDPISIILLETFHAGFLIKTYYLKLNVVHGFKPPQEVIVRTDHDFWKKQKENLGMSIYRKLSDEDIASTTPMPPGSMYVGNSSFGRWVYSDSGARTWYFYGAYRSYPDIFMWKEFKPTYKFYITSKQYLENKVPFFGLNNEFGTNGKITKQSLESQIQEIRKHHLSVKLFKDKYLSIPSWKNRHTKRKEKEKI